MKNEFIITNPDNADSLILSADELLSVLGARRKSIAWLAREIGESRPLTSMVIHGHRRSPVIVRKISDRIAKLLAEMPANKRQALIQAA